MKKTYGELQDEALIREGGNICDISIDQLRSPTMRKMHKHQCPVPEKEKGKKGIHRAAQRAGMSRAERSKLYNSVNEAESRKDALKRAAAIAKWKKAGGKVEKQPPSPGRGDEKMGKAVQDYKKKHKKKENRIGAGNMFKRQWKGQRKNSSFIPRGEEVGEGYQEISNLVDITQNVMSKMIKAMQQDDFKTVIKLYKELGKIIK